MPSYPSRTPSGLPVPVAEGGTGATTASAGLAALGGLASEASKSPDFPAADSDTNNWRFSPPFASAQIQSITVGAIGTAPTAGTVAFTKGIAAGGNTCLSAATYSLSGLSDNAMAAMALTGTTADLQGGLTDGFVMTVVNTDGPVFASVEWGPQ